jgi:hypothetical protein
MIIERLSNLSHPTHSGFVWIIMLEKIEKSACIQNMAKPNLTDAHPKYISKMWAIE